MKFPKCKRFWLLRVRDCSGVSGEGVVAQGVIWETGKCTMSWLTNTNSIAVYDGIGTLMAIHGHKGATKVIYEDDPNYAEYMTEGKDVN